MRAMQRGRRMIGWIKRLLGDAKPVALPDPSPPSITLPDQASAKVSAPKQDPAPPDSRGTGASILTPADEPAIAITPPAEPDEPPTAGEARISSEAHAFSSEVAPRQKPHKPVALSLGEIKSDRVNAFPDDDTPHREPGTSPDATTTTSTSAPHIQPNAQLTTEISQNPTVCGRTSSCRNLGNDVCPLKQGLGRSDCPSYSQLENGEIDVGSAILEFSATSIKEPQQQNVWQDASLSTIEISPSPTVCGRTSSCTNLGTDVCPLKQGLGRSDCPSYSQTGLAGERDSSHSFTSLTQNPAWDHAKGPVPTPTPVFSSEEPQRQKIEEPLTLSPGELNRRRVAEILNRPRPPLPPALPSQQNDRIDGTPHKEPGTPPDANTPSPSAPQIQPTAQKEQLQGEADFTKSAATHSASNAADTAPRLYQPPSRSYLYKEATGRLGCGKTSDCGNYQKPACPLAGGATRHIDWCHSFYSKTISYGYGGFVAGHWRRSKSGKMTWVKPHYKRR